MFFLRLNSFLTKYVLFHGSHIFLCKNVKFHKKLLFHFVSLIPFSVSFFDISCKGLSLNFWIFRVIKNKNIFSILIEFQINKISYQKHGFSIVQDFVTIPDRLYQEDLVQLCTQKIITKADLSIRQSLFCQHIIFPLCSNKKKSI